MKAKRPALTVVRGSTSPIVEPIAQSDNQRGVWDADAADGDVALVVYGCNGRRLLRLEMALDVYSPDWIHQLEDWLATHEPERGPRLVGDGQ